MAIGWLYLYSRFRKVKKERDLLEEGLEHQNEICGSCGYPRYKHADNEEQTCPSY
jgi:hypothetical protein